MPKQGAPRKSLKELMRTGEGLSGFDWPETDPAAKAVSALCHGPATR